MNRPIMRCRLALTVVIPLLVACGGGGTGVVTVPPAPAPTLFPPTVTTGTGATVLVTGHGFNTGSAVRWNGGTVPSGYIDSTMLLAQIPAAGLGSAGSGSITVSSVSGGNGTTAPATLTVAAAAAPTHPAATAIGVLSLSGRPHGIAIAPTGMFYISQIDGNAATRGIVTPTDQQFVGTTAVGGQPAHVAIDASATHAYTADQGGHSMSVISALPNTAVIRPIAEQGFNILTSADGARVYETTAEGHLIVWDAASQQQLAQVSVGTSPNGLARDDTRHLLFVSSRDNATVVAIDLSTNAIIHTYTVDAYPQRIALSPDGTELYVANEGSGLDVLNVATGSRAMVIGVSPGAVGLAMSPDGAQLWVTNPPAGTVTIVDRGSRAVVKTLQGLGRPRNVAFTADGHTGIVTDEFGRVLFVR